MIKPSVGIGIPHDESSAILHYLYQHAESPLFQCRFRWTENAIAFWDTAASSTARCGTTGRTPAPAPA